MIFDGINVVVSRACISIFGVIVRIVAELNRNLLKRGEQPGRNTDEERKKFLQRKIHV